MYYSTRKVTFILFSLFIMSCGKTNNTESVSSSSRETQRVGSSIIRVDDSLHHIGDWKIKGDTKPVGVAYMDKHSIWVINSDGKTVVLGENGNATYFEAENVFEKSSEYYIIDVESRDSNSFYLLLSENEQNKLSVYYPMSKQVKEIETTGIPKRIALDAETNKLYYIDEKSRLHLTDNQEEELIQPGEIGNKILNIAITKKTIAFEVVGDNSEIEILVADLDEHGSQRTSVLEKEVSLSGTDNEGKIYIMKTIYNKDEPEKTIGELISYDIAGKKRLTVAAGKISCAFVYNNNLIIFWFVDFYNFLASLYRINEEKPGATKTRDPSTLWGANGSR